MQSNIVPKHTNSLINESSPYLLQHAHNPVNWMPWCDSAFEKAKKENKLVLISIGYSACHWCHVMEKECFEDEQVAAIMNDFFINIKVDREERPDVDQIYMTAVQLMTQRGGWPLNCFVLPDGRPIYGGTYFPQQQWKNILMNLADVWKTEPEKALSYAEKLTEGIKQSDIINVNSAPENFSIETLHTTVDNWKVMFDTIYGGPDRAPKFPLPNNYLFLLRYGYQTKNNEILQHVFLTLDKMSDGGIYDQIGGVFARYSTDVEWKVPHFEKMLYDNALLISLYAEAYKLTKNERYKNVINETIHFIERELLDESGAFYSALDADTEGVEGKFYVWQKEELQTLLGADYAIAAEYYNINDYGYWEHNNYVLIKNDSDEIVAKSLNISIEELNSQIKNINEILFTARTKRVSPGLDDKTLTSWNALMISGLAAAYSALNDERFLTLAIKNANFICDQQLKEDGTLYHSYKKGKSSIDGFLEDYCFTIEAFIDLYQCTFDEQWLSKAELLAQTTIKHFYDSENGFFYFTSNQSKQLISRKIEYSDNVIPASCSSMANALFKLGKLTGKEAYEAMALKMLNTIQLQIPNYGAGYSNWCNLLLNVTSAFYEVAIVGKAVNEKRASLQQHYIPNVIFTGSVTESNNHLLAKRYVENKTLIYVCENKVCKAPTREMEEALKILAAN